MKRRNDVRDQETPDKTSNVNPREQENVKPDKKRPPDRGTEHDKEDIERQNE